MTLRAASASRLILCSAALSILCSASPTAISAEDAAEAVAAREYNATAALQNSGLYGRAAEKWAAFIAKHPEDQRLDRAHYYLGICQLHTKKFADAAASFSTVLSKYPQFSMLEGAQYNLAMALYQQAAEANDAAQLKTAAAELAAHVQKFPQSPHAAKAIYFQAEALYSAGDTAAAIEAYQKLLATAGKSSLVPDALYALGTIQQELGALDEAVKTYHTFLADAAHAKHDLAAEVRLRLGLCQFQQQHYAEAEKTFGEAAGVADFAHADLALLRQAQSRLEQAKLAEAIAALGDLEKRFPQSRYHAAGQVTKGKTHYQLQQLDQATGPLEQVWKAEVDESAEADYWLGRCLLKQSKPDAALTLLEAAVAKYPQGEFSPHLQLARIDALTELPQRRKDSIAAYESFAKQHPDHALAPQALYQAAATALAEADHATAERLADAFLADAKNTDNPLKPAALYVAAESRLLAASNGDDVDQVDIARAEAARQRYEQLVAQFPDHGRAPLARVRVGWCHFRSEQFDEAAKQLAAALGTLPDPQLKAEAHFLIARSHNAAKRHPQAAAAYDAALQAKADWARADEVLLAAAQNRREQNQPEPARQLLQRLIDTLPDSSLRPQALYELGELAQQSNKLDEAVARYQEIADKHTDSLVAPAALYAKAAVQYAQRKFGETIAALDQLVAKYPEAPAASSALLLRGLAHQQENRLEVAVKDLQKFLAAGPASEDQFTAQYALAVCQIGLKQHEPAITSLQQLIAQRIDDPEADRLHYELAHVLLETEKPAQAAAAFRGLTERTPQSPLVAESWFQVGRFHEQAADSTPADDVRVAELDRAAAAYEKGLEKAADNDMKEKLRYKLADMLYRQEKYADAATQLATLMQQHAKGELFGPAAFLAAECHFRQDRFNDALPLYQQVAQRRVEKYHAQALYRAGASAGQLKRWPQSQAFYNQLLQTFPQFEQADEARYGIAWALQNQNQKPQARAAYEKLSDSDSEAGAKARFMLGELAFEDKRYEEAIEQFLFVAVGYPYPQWQGLARFEAARCFMELQRNDQAIEQLQTLVDRFADHPKAQDAAAMLAKLKD